MLLASPAASQVVPGILGFLVVAAMGIALFFLLRSMNKQLRKVVPDPAWRKEARKLQAGAQEEQDQEQDFSHNGVAKP